jgi:hypothetical protein
MIYRCPIDTCGRLIEAPDDAPPTCEGAPMKDHDPRQAVPYTAPAARADVPDPRAGATGDGAWDDAIAAARGLLVDGEAVDPADAVAQLIASGSVAPGDADSLRIALAAEGDA